MIYIIIYQGNYKLVFEVIIVDVSILNSIYFWNLMYMFKFLASST